MSRAAARLRQERAAADGLGSNRNAVKYLKQDYEALKQQCLRAGTLFKDEEFPACPSALGYQDLGPYSFKTQGIVWKRPTVRMLLTACFTHPDLIKAHLNIHAKAQIPAIPVCFVVFFCLALPPWLAETRLKGRWEKKKSTPSNPLQSKESYNCFMGTCFLLVHPSSMEL